MRTEIGERHAQSDRFTPLHQLEAQLCQIDSIERFYQWFSYRDVFPCKAAFFCRGIKNSLGVSIDLEICVNLPETYLKGLTNAAGGIQSPLLERWIKEGGKPVYFDADESASAVPPRWFKNFTDFGFNTIVIHGSLHEYRDTISVFGLYNAPDYPELSPVLSLDEATALMHRALERVPSPRGDKRVRLPFPLSGDEPLTPRETEVIHWLQRGKTNPEIATILGISKNTVRNHLYNAMQKLSAHSRTEVVLRGSDFR